MKILITYSSKTGNTRKIAEAVRKGVPAADFYPVEAAPDPENYDLIFMGFWVDKGSADHKAGEYMSRIRNKKVAFFATLGAYPDSKHAAESLEKAETLIQESKVIDRFICQGAIDPVLQEWMSKLPGGHPHAPDDARIKRWEDASSHPDEKDCEAAKNWAMTVLQN